MGWRVSWRVFDQEKWLRTRPDASLEMALGHEVVENSRWTSVVDALAAQPRATQEWSRI
jgi:hypothetical protein